MAVFLTLNNGEVVELRPQIISDNPEAGAEAFAGTDKDDVFWWVEPHYVTPVAGRTDLSPDLEDAATQ